MVFTLDGAKRLQNDEGGAVQGLFFKLQERQGKDPSFGKKICTGHAGSSSESKNWNYLRHNGGNIQQETTAQGASGTRFHKGFSRRSGSAIGQDKERIQRDKYKEQRGEAVADARRVELKAKDKRNDFNVITSSNKLPEKDSRPLRKVIGETKSKTLNREADIILRDSSSRYFGNCEPPSQRTGVIRTEGLLNQRYTSLLGIGRSEVQSYGVADSFQHSMYGQRGTAVGRGGVQQVSNVAQSQKAAQATRPW